MPSLIQDAEKAFVERLKRIGQDFSQAEIARRTNTRVTNVNRYMHGTRVPGVFLSSLVSGLGVNPGWLLTGEGAVYATDVSGPTQNMAADLLELVEAMKTVAQMRLGSIAGKPHLGVVRKLNEAMGEYGKIRDRLNDQSRDVMMKLIADLKTALDKRDQGLADDLLDILKQVRLLCHDVDAQREFKRVLAYYEYEGGRLEEAMDAMRTAFLQRLSNTGTVDEGALNDAVNLCIGLSTLRRDKDVLRLANAALALADGIGNDWPVYGTIQMTRCSANANQFNLRAAITEAMKVYPQLEAGGQRVHSARMVYLLWLGGVLRQRGLFDYSPATIAKHRMILYAAIYDGDNDFIKIAVKECVGNGEQQLEELSMEAICADALLKRDEPGTWKEFKRRMSKLEATETPIETLRFPNSAWQTQIAIACGRATEAGKLVTATQEIYDGTDDSVVYLPSARATHWRNVLRLSQRKKSTMPPELVAQANEFFATVAREGFSALRA